MEKVKFEFNKEDIEKEIRMALLSQVKSYATSIGLASFNLSDYIKGNMELQKIIKNEIEKRLKDKKFMNNVIKDIFQETITKNIKFGT